MEGRLHWSFVAAMTEIQRKKALARVKKIAHDARHLVAYDCVSSPPDWRPFVAELAEEVANLLDKRERRRRRSTPHQPAPRKRA